MRKPTLTTRRIAATLALGLALPLASAAPVTYTLAGHFTGTAFDKPEFIAAISPLLTGHALALTLTVDTAAAGSHDAGFPGQTLYRAITASTARFAGFDTTSFACNPTGSELICSVHAHDGQGQVPGSFDPDAVSFFPAIATAAAFDAATGLNRALSLQFMMFASDFTGQALADDSLQAALSTLDPARIIGRLGVFARAADGQFSDRASFEFQLDSVSTDAAAALPEPGSPALAALALAALGAVRARRPCASTAR